MSEQQELQKAIAAQKSYIGPSIITFILYWLFYLPGLIVNLMYIGDANRTAKIAGQKPSGYGCLIALMIFGIFPLIATGLLILAFLGVDSAAIAPFIYTLF